MLKNTLTGIYRLTILKWSYFSSRRLYVALTLFPASVLIKQESLFDGINQQHEILLVKYIH